MYRKWSFGCLVAALLGAGPVLAEDPLLSPPPVSAYLPPGSLAQAPPEGTTPKEPQTPERPKKPQTPQTPQTPETPRSPSSDQSNQSNQGNQGNQGNQADQSNQANQSSNDTSSFAQGSPAGAESSGVPGVVGDLISGGSVLKQEIITTTTISPVTTTIVVPGPSAQSHIAAAMEAGMTATITTTAPNHLSPGQTVTISGVGVAAYNGTYNITSTPTPTSFTYTNPTGGWHLRWAARQPALPPLWLRM